MILSVTFSKPGKEIEETFGKQLEKIKINIENSSKGTAYFAQMFTKTQVFHEHFTEDELQVFIEKHAGKSFKNCVIHTDTEEKTILANKKGKITELTKKLKADVAAPLKIIPQNRKKNYILQEGTPVPFLVMLGIMNADGKVISSKYDKFKQINRFLEFIDDIIPQLDDISNRPLRIVDFGCGKSYLTFAVHYFLTQVKHIPCQIEGLDLKQDVIDYCNDMAKKLSLEGLVFKTGNISDYSGKDAPDIVITLHACDTATDFALQYAVQKGARAILSVPCCQHQVNQQLQSADVNPEFEPLLKWGIIREKFSALVTDALRGEWLESKGYKVQMLEFIDMEHTPKNILIRAVKTNSKDSALTEQPSLLSSLNIKPELWK